MIDPSIETEPRWVMQNDCLTFYSYADQKLPLARITTCWPKLGVQAFDVAYYPDGHRDTASEGVARYFDLWAATQAAEIAIRQKLGLT